MGRRIIHLRIKNTATAGYTPSFLVRTILLLDPVDEDYLLPTYPTILNEIKEILSLHIHEILPFAASTTATGTSGSHSSRGTHNEQSTDHPSSYPPPQFGASSSSSSIKQPTGSGKYARVNLTSQEYGYVGDTTICSFSTRPFDFAYNVLSLNHIGSTLEIAVRTVDHYDEQYPTPKKNNISSSSTTLASTSTPSNPIHEGFQAESIANIQLFIRILHRERQHQRTIDALTSNPNKLDHYYGNSGSTKNNDKSQIQTNQDHHPNTVHTSSSSSSSSVPSGTTLVNVPNHDIAAIQRFTNQPTSKSLTSTSSGTNSATTKTTKKKK